MPIPATEERSVFYYASVTHLTGGHKRAAASPARHRAFDKEQFDRSAFAELIAAAASTALLDELETWPKPGLVSHVDAGSHTDMDAGTFRRSTAAIKPYFSALATAGAAGAQMDDLRKIGIEAEQAMLAATNGVNAHRGAIFGVGLLCAAAGAAVSAKTSSSFAVRTCAPSELCDIVRRRWGHAILTGPIPMHSHGTNALRRFGVGGARAEAAAGFPTVLRVGLPALQFGRRLAAGDDSVARVQAFFALLADVDDTNLLHRGGAQGLDYARRAAFSFLADGGVGRPGWLEDAAALHRGFVDRRLSPGGCADLLAITVFLAILKEGV
jgi:triphosphoribosyl-dephospho-CoA synthase